MKNKHNDNISMEKDNGKHMKNDHHKQIKKLEMMMKKNFQLGVEIETMKRKVKSLGDGNANEFKQLAQEYVELTSETQPKDFFNFTYENPPPPPPPPPAEETSTYNNYIWDLFDKIEEDAIYIFNDIIEIGNNK